MVLVHLDSLVTAALQLAALLLQGVAFVNCLIQPADAFKVADKWSKPGWAILTLVALLLVQAPLFGGLLSLFGIGGIIASLVYLLDVRPAVREISRGRGGSSGRNTGRW
ncbi:MAG: DUF2516 domain-containing protein [Pseudonocardiales bacterium]|nr:MAG: DUF2516 domain-containing protein [Pseudonocardiales bacterium]